MDVMFFRLPHIRVGANINHNAQGGTYMPDEKVVLVNVPGIEKTSDGFRAKVMAIAERLETNPNFLMAVMCFESGRTFRPDIRNPASGAVGLIQFMEPTAKGLG